MPSQVSLTEQLAELVKLANKAGLYDAADAVQRLIRQQRPACWCRRCEDAHLAGAPWPEQITGRRFIVCPECGNKRCPRASSHEHACTGSNEPNQPGSDYCFGPRVAGSLEPGRG